MFRDKLEGARSPPKLHDGQEVRLTSDGVVIGRGLAAAEGPIAVRVWSHDDEPVDALVAARVKAAAELRALWFDDARTTAYRVVHGEGDRMPGVVVDRYGASAVLVLDDAGARARLDAVADAVWGELAPRGVRALLLRTRERGTRDKSVELLRGEEAQRRVVVREHDVPFVVDLDRGQKTGAFLDQRDNRRRVGEIARERRVLNLFSYTGGFSLHAALGGARRVTSVDVAAPAHASAQESFKLAGLDPSAHEFVAQDAFAFLDEAARGGARWDLVISDPPSFAPNKKAVPNALGAYRKLHRACVAVLERGGLFCASSCSSHVDAAMFASTLDDAALGTGSLRLLALHGHPVDHPTLPAWPEGRYLKFAILG